MLMEMCDPSKIIGERIITPPEKICLATIFRLFNFLIHLSFSFQSIGDLTVDL